MKSKVPVLCIAPLFAMQPVMIAKLGSPRDDSDSVLHGAGYYSPRYLNVESYADTCADVLKFNQHGLTDARIKSYLQRRHLMRRVAEYSWYIERETFQGAP